MYAFLLSLHSLVRWLVLTGLLVSLYRAYHGLLKGRSYTKLDDSIRHWTATAAHVQLLLGLSLYMASPLIHYFFHNYRDAVHIRGVRFFGMEHSVMMLVAIVIVTVGSAKAKRSQLDRNKHRTVAIWYTVALLIILISIPWPFSPLASRPYIRPF